MVIYEVLSGHKPFYQYTDYVVSGKVLKGDRPERPQGSDGVVGFTDDVWEISELCWEPLPQDRPGIEDVLKRLKTVASSWILPSPLLMAVPSAVHSPTSSEQIVGVDEREVFSPSQPSDQPPPKDDVGNHSIHPPVDGFSALLHVTPDHQDLGDPGGFVVSTSPPVCEEDRSQFRPPQLFDSSFDVRGRDYRRDHESHPRILELESHCRIVELESRLAIRGRDKWGYSNSYRMELEIKLLDSHIREGKVSGQRNANISDTDSTFRSACNPSMFALYVPYYRPGG
jgi:hypothetical protein